MAASDESSRAAAARDEGSVEGAHPHPPCSRLRRDAEGRQEREIVGLVQAVRTPDP
jgi:hypothetical protein